LATVGPVSGVVTGVGSGTATITYSLGGCTTTYNVTVSGSLSSITGPTAVCAGSTIQLSDATGGGVWSSSNTTVATIAVTGVVSGVTAGTTNISYTVGTCSVGIVVTVSTLTPITGNTGVCAGSTMDLSDATAGGTWSSGGTTAATVSASGVVTGVASGSATIYYTLGACTVSTLVNVSSAVPSILGSVTTVCAGATISLSDAAPGGVWSSTNTGVATVSGGVVVHGVAGGTTTISYTIGGCAASTVITVLANNAGTIIGKDSICVGVAHAYVLSDSVSGGVWSSSNVARATVGSLTGIVTGVSTGAFTITYTVTNSCGTFKTTKVMHVKTALQCALGVAQPADEETATELQVFPNPNSGIFTMDLMSGIDEEVHVIITNIVGEKVRDIITTTNRPTDIKLDPAAGIYIISASTVHGRYVAKVAVH
jgi:hypothetical protein